MRLTSIFFRNARQPQNVEKIPFKAVAPLKLQNFVNPKLQGITGIFKEQFCSCCDTVDYRL